MPTMVERIAERILQEYENHELYVNQIDASMHFELREANKIIFGGSEEDCNEQMRITLARRYTRAALDELRKPDAAMLWARSKGYEAMIEAALK